MSHFCYGRQPFALPSARLTLQQVAQLGLAWSCRRATTAGDVIDGFANNVEFEPDPVSEVDLHFAIDAAGRTEAAGHHPAAARRSAFRLSPDSSEAVKIWRPKMRVAHFSCIIDSICRCNVMRYDEMRSAGADITPEKP